MKKGKRERKEMRIIKKYYDGKKVEEVMYSIIKIYIRNEADKKTHSSE
jgi:hypothetical protein